MLTGSQGDGKQKVETFVDDLKSKMVYCPNCKEQVPKSLYCLRCGYPLYTLKEEERGENEEGAGSEAGPEGDRIEEVDTDFSIGPEVDVANEVEVAKSALNEWEASIPEVVVQDEEVRVVPGRSI